MNFSKRLRSLFSHKIKVNYDGDTSIPVLTNVKLLKHYSMNCHCGSIAIPVSVKSNKYQCIQCNINYIGISYNFGQIEVDDRSLNILPKHPSQLIDMTCYDDSVAFLKSEKHTY